MQSSSQIITTNKPTSSAQVKKNTEDTAELQDGISIIMHVTHLCNAGKLVADGTQ